MKVLIISDYKYYIWAKDQNYLSLNKNQIYEAKRFITTSKGSYYLIPIGGYNTYIPSYAVKLLNLKLK